MQMSQQFKPFLCTYKVQKKLLISTVYPLPSLTCWVTVILRDVVGLLGICLSSSFFSSAKLHPTAALSCCHTLSQSASSLFVRVKMTYETGMNQQRLPATELLYRCFSPPPLTFSRPKWMLLPLTSILLLKLKGIREIFDKHSRTPTVCILPSVQGWMSVVVTESKN